VPALVTAPTSQPGRPAGTGLARPLVVGTWDAGNKEGAVAFYSAKTLWLNICQLVLSSTRVLFYKQHTPAYLGHRSRRDLTTPCTIREDGNWPTCRDKPHTFLPRRPVWRTLGGRPSHAAWHRPGSFPPSLNGSHLLGLSRMFQLTVYGPRGRGSGFLGYFLFYI
jgi:hypothetical protein